MEALTFELAAQVLDDAIYLQPTLDGGDKTINFGIDAQGREFVLIVSAMDGKGRFGLL